MESILGITLNIHQNLLKLKINLFKGLMVENMKENGKITICMEKG
jgi:hypothetical protein